MGSLPGSWLAARMADLTDLSSELIDRNTMQAKGLMKLNFSVKRFFKTRDACSVSNWK